MAESKTQSPSSPPYLVRLIVYHCLKRRPDHMTCFGYIKPLIEAGLLPNDTDQFSIEIQQVRVGSWKREGVKIEIYERHVEGV